MTNIDAKQAQKLVAQCLDAERNTILDAHVKALINKEITEEAKKGMTEARFNNDVLKDANPVLLSSGFRHWERVFQQKLPDLVTFYEELGFSVSVRDNFLTLKVLTISWKE
jgi:hypothetical protein